MISLQGKILDSERNLLLNIEHLEKQDFRFLVLDLVEFQSRKQMLKQQKH